jgi:hypothetical protein
MLHAEDIRRIHRASKSNFECARFRDFFGRLLQAAGKTPGARAKLAQIFKRVDSSIMAVAPAEMQSVVAHGSNTTPLQAGGNASMTDFAYACELLNTGGAHAVLPQIP